MANTDKAGVAAQTVPTSMGRLVELGSRFANSRGVYLGRRSTRLHVALYRRFGGRVGGHLPGWPNARILLLDHVGAKSGVRRTSPVMYYEDGDSIAVVASKAGQPTNPAWFHNLLAHPETTIQIGSQTRRVVAHMASGSERDVLWPICLSAYPGYEFFQRLAHPRIIPIVLLEPIVTT
ncbi:nitroreductase family deazaflavin-dependent oxidoreductase [Nocardia sp. NBC_01503]|uniref:nitroreductase family deazaflavin-dependent oxidoreductase n=1 Tax=Nocardia sp. NBC_01503 TaxID=2975997 RepID=UPI002E7B76A5|nr:nitroreductase family deazaflavin-dependent oxidoreductase [Nocardia sp. NBC_01503]WTL31777.1 nitroreductase family deazaflavin-dependent oxidoreductase [Nocardia sp. NBC_01503]